MNYHPYTAEFYERIFGLATPPPWAARTQELITHISYLHDRRQARYYGEASDEECKQIKWRISKRFVITYAHIEQLCGLCLVDLSQPYSVLKAFFDMSQPRIQIKRK